MLQRAKHTLYLLAALGAGALLGPLVTGIRQVGPDILWAFILLSAAVLVYSGSKLVAAFQSGRHAHGQHHHPGHGPVGWDEV